MGEDSIELCPQKDGSVTVSLPCGDTFMSACADSQNVTIENLPILEQVFKDVLALTPAYTDEVYRKEHPHEWVEIVIKLANEISIIFACRVRNMRPFYHHNSYGVSARLNPLIEAIKK